MVHNLDEAPKKEEVEEEHGPVHRTGEARPAREAR